VKFKTEVTEFEFWDSEEEWSGDGLLTSTKEEDAASVLVSDDDVEVELMPLEEDVRLCSIVVSKKGYQYFVVYFSFLVSNVCLLRFCNQKFMLKICTSKL
jgi:hypothetical protein